MNASWSRSSFRRQVTPEPSQESSCAGNQAIAGAQHPVILAGNGVIRGHAHEAVRTFARQLEIPVLHTFMAKGILPDSDPLSLYTIGLQARRLCGGRHGTGRCRHCDRL